MSRLTITILLAAVAGFISSGLPARGQDAADHTEADLAVIGEQIDIMRLVIAKSINRSYRELVEKKQPDEDDRSGEAFPGATQGPSLLEGAGALRSLAMAYDTQGRTSFTSHTRAFYGEGVGVFFTTDISTPVELRERDEDGGDEPKPDEWSEAEDEARGMRTNLFSPRGQQQMVWWSIDEDFVEAAIGSALAMLAKHGDRIDALPEDQDFIVGLRFNAGRQLSSGSRRSDQVVRGLVSGDTTFFGAVGKGVEQTVVVRISKRSVLRYGGAEADLRSLRGQAKITRYGVKHSQVESRRSGRTR